MMIIRNVWSKETLQLKLCIYAFFVLLSKNDQVLAQAQSMLAGQEQPPPPQPTAPWYETLPAVAMDYKVIIDPGKEDCYFQFVNPGATFYASAQVKFILQIILNFYLFI